MGKSIKVLEQELKELGESLGITEVLETKQPETLTFKEAWKKHSRTRANYTNEEKKLYAKWHDTLQENAKLRKSLNKHIKVLDEYRDIITSQDNFFKYVKKRDTKNRKFLVEVIKEIKAKKNENY